MQELVLVVGDVELGPGGPTDDFPQSAWIATWLQERPEASRVDLVFAGDTFDFLKTPVDGTWPRHIDAGVALRKWDTIASAHPGFLDAIASWLQEPSHNVWFLIGNHDLELQFSPVRKAIAERLCAVGQVHFPGMELTLGDLRILHGHRHDTMFWVDGPAFVKFADQEILNLPWGAVALLDVVMPLLPTIGALDRLKPRERVFQLLPEARRLAQEVFWRYWTRDFWWDLMEGDPVKHVSAAMLREIVYRMGTADPELGADKALLQDLALPDAPRVTVVGHWHRPAWHTVSDRRLLMLGAFRNEFQLHPDGTIGAQLGKVHAEIWMENGQVLRSNLVESTGAPPPAHYMPDHLDAFRPLLQERLAALSVRSAG